jgi:hypothetical protein
MMPRVRIIHWREEEAGGLIETCRSAGFQVDYDAGGGTVVTRAIRAKLPDVFAIDLSRLPSHGREVAVWLRRAKRTRSIPLVFVGGEQAKIAAIRGLLPDAWYCQPRNVASALRRALQAKATGCEPVAPTAVPEKAAALKLGIAAGGVVSVIQPPRGFPELLGEIPDDVEFTESSAPLTLWFLHDRESLMEGLREMRRLAARTKLWLVWRKGGKGEGLTQNLVRETAREAGLVDYKICSVDQNWSAMLFALKKS